QHFAVIDRLDLLAELKRALARYDGTLDFALPSALTEEWPPSGLDPSIWRPRIWVDQFHFSPTMGAAVMASLLNSHVEERAPYELLNSGKDPLPHLQSWIQK